jgi:hypothetical protein
MIIHLISVSDQLQLPEFDDIFRAILGWSGNPGYVIRIPRAGVQQSLAKPVFSRRRQRPGSYRIATSYCLSALGMMRKLRIVSPRAGTPLRFAGSNCQV